MLFSLFSCQNLKNTLPISQNEFIENAQFVQNISVTVSDNRYIGTGILIQSGNSTYVLTASHIFTESKIQIGVRFEKGHTYQRFIINPPLIFKDSYDSRTGQIDETMYTGRVVLISETQNDEDLCLIKLSDNLNIKPVRFYSGLAPTGTFIYHCGQFQGDEYSNTISYGVVTNIGRRLDNGPLFLQSNVEIQPGSSGGGAFDSQHRLIGVFLRKADDVEEISFLRSSKDVIKWLNENGKSYIYDNSVPTPDKEDDFVIEKQFNFFEKN